VLAWALWALVMLGMAASFWLESLLRRAGRPDPLDTAVAPTLAILSAATVGAVLAGRRPRHPVGWLLLAVALSLAANGVVGGYAPYGLQVQPGVLPAAAWVALYYPATALTPLALLSLVLLLTPTGSLPSPRWRWWAWLTVGAPAVLLLVMPLAPRPPEERYQGVDNPLDLRPFDGALLAANRALLAVTALGVLVGAGSLVVRFRRARGTERQQLRWLVLAAALTGVGMLASVVLLAAGNQVLVGWVSGSVWRCCPWRSAPRSCATGCSTWTASSAARWPTGCSRCCWAVAMPWSSSGWVSSSAGIPPWSWPARPWPWRRCFSRPAAASSGRSTGGSTAAATMLPRPSQPSARGYATTSTWPP
jgi:hypothetical protein